MASFVRWIWNLRSLVLVSYAGPTRALLVGLFLICLAGCSSKRPVVAESQPAEPLELFAQRPIGRQSGEYPRIAYLQIVDLDRDGMSDVLVCDCVDNCVTWIRQVSRGEFSETILADQLVAPAHLECVDFDADGDTDVFIAVLGKLFPSNDPIGSLLVLENQGAGKFLRRTLLQDVARISDVRSGDLDGDNDLDLVVTHFGYDDGEIRWLENVGDWKFTSHPLQNKAGGIHSIIADINGDKTSDIVSLISQQHEQVYAFLGNGKGQFLERQIFASDNSEYGSAGIWLEDMDGDKDLDVLYCNGDALDYSPPRPWPWHGVQWLENLDGKTFKFHRLTDFGGAVVAKAVDYDHDGDMDIFVASAFNDWFDPASPCLLLLENTGKMRFKTHSLGNSPTHLQAMDAADIDGDGDIDLVTGGMHVAEPYDRIGRIMLWEMQ